ncbi:MAG: TonB-dependent receptor [Phenylobacterium sp.]|uniref:TonB-dependent receptor n=1 Tax=Phenylobacterium sp. TaxID=1871053 RepID=UPI0025D83D34|nr:TonB-dependent receptor [Phenylobacterium sp.]MBI1199334.1 TonB-dependent receptor [Phenylobacterium sp.]
MSRVSLFAAAGVLALVSTAARADDAGPTKDLHEVVVTGAPYVVSIQSTTTSVNVVKREDLDLAPTAGLGDVLASLPGVRSSFFGPGASRPVIRGLSGPRVLVLNNGVGLIDASGLSPDHQVATDPQEAERIEVLRGPSALAYGGSAIGGVVNVIDQRIPSDYQDGVHGRGLLEYSTVDNGRQGSGALRVGLGNGVSLTVDGTHRRADDYKVPVDPISDRLAQSLGLPTPSNHGTKVPNSYVDLDAFGAGASWVGDGAWGGLAVKHTNTEYGSPAEEDVFIRLHQTRVDTRGGADINLGPFDKIKFAGGWANYKHTEFEGGTPGTTFLSKGEEGRIELVQPNRGGWQGALGFQGLHRNFDAIGDEALIPATKINELGVFTLQRLDKGGWGVEGGARVDTRSVKNIRADRDFTNLSASLGVFARPADGLFLGLALSRTSRAPTEEELSSDGPHPATGLYEVGDAALSKEISNSADASLHYAKGGWSIDLHGYYVRYENYIDQFATGAVDANSGLPIFQFIEGGARFYGYEIETSWEAWRDGDRSLSFEAGSDYVRGTTSLGPAPRIPPWSVSGKATYVDGPFTGGLEVRHVAKQGRVAAVELPTDAYTLVNASLVVRPLADQDLKVFLEASNLTNVEAREHASFLKDVAPLPGRNFRLGVGYQF